MDLLEGFWKSYGEEFMGCGFMQILSDLIKEMYIAVQIENALNEPCPQILFIFFKRCLSQQFSHRMSLAQIPGQT